MVPKGSSAPATAPRLQTNKLRFYHFNDDMCDVESSIISHIDASGEKKRQLFWRNVVKQFNFTDQLERELLLSLTGGICWMQMRMLPKDFMLRHREIYYLISTFEYDHSSAIGRDVTRTFSIFERSHQHQLAAHQNALFRVLNAIAKAENVYCQGMNFIAALFLVEGLSEADAYALFLYILKKRHLAGIYHRSSTFLDKYLQHFEQMFIQNLPELYAHLLAQGFVVSMYGVEWFTTLFSLSTKTDLACAIFDLFFAGLHDIFLRAGLAILKLLEAKLMCMTFEDYLRGFKQLVRQLDPYAVILQALTFRPNSNMNCEDTISHVSREHFIKTSGAVAPSCSYARTSSSDSSSADSDDELVSSIGGFGLHRTLPPTMADAIRAGRGSLVCQLWEAHVVFRDNSILASVILANEILHYAIWHGRVSIACLAIERCNANVDNRDDAGLTPLHFSVIRNQPDIIRLLLVHGARMQETRMQRLSPLELAHRWKRRDTTAARLVLEKDEVCLYCNTKFDVLALEAAVCGKCEFRFCCKPKHNLCIFKHQCSKAGTGRDDGCNNDRRLSEPLMAMSNTQDEAFGSDSEEESALDFKIGYDRSRGSSTSTATSTSASCRVGGSASLSRSMSLSSSLDLSNSQVLIGSSPAMSWLDSPRFVDNYPNAANISQSDNTGMVHGGSVLRPKWHSDTRALLEFPDRPDWYCNARECHFVFAIFSQAVKCVRCEGYYCSKHVNWRFKHCFKCQRDVVCTNNKECKHLLLNIS
ncbi:tbc1 domain member related [Plasmopara halstedii]|uniref:Tbc1 domain member related n=1 Tax=Plasmopara halstedii TaxID=4781 RepID=A0A0P1AVQ4_PLAHL|nr:tbc1 domain member related [Plasmopara halstedii]CEG44591.1 tbc1 domain member related [Plasmopara halstedii]|eukprot:XP_024580960.1 tbc1 domain member related [Plasmopara halstedii]